MGWGARRRIHQNLGRVELALLSGAQHAGKHLLGVGAASRAIPAADLAVDDGGTQGVLSAPVGGVDGGFEEKAEERRQLGAQMGGESLHGRDGADVVQCREQVILHMATGHGGAMRRDDARDAPVADAERLLQGGLDARGERGAGVVACQVARAAQQVGHTGLMGGGGEATVWRPPVTDQHAGIVGPEDRRRLQEPPPRLNGIDRRGAASGVAKAHNHCPCPSTFQLVSSGATTGLPRMVAHSAA